MVRKKEMLYRLCFSTLLWRVQVNQDGLKLNGTHPLLVYANDINILKGSVHTIKENSETLIVANKVIGLE
jgi:hypothetical protein